MPARDAIANPGSEVIRLHWATRLPMALIVRTDATMMTAIVPLLGRVCVASSVTGQR